MFKLIALLYAISLANPQAEPKPFAKFVANGEFETKELCAASVDGIMKPAVTDMNNQFAEKGIRIVGAQVMCSDDPKDAAPDAAPAKTEKPQGEKL
jgi:hypothetical protein